MKNKTFTQKFAFTLAEVLITLGVIGVISAITIPTVISNYKKQITVSKLKKAYSTLSQMATNSYAENGYFTEFFEIGETLSAEKTEKFFNTYMLPYLKSTEVANPKFYSSPWPYANSDMKIATVYGNGTYSFRTSDGIIYTVWIADPSGGNSKGTFNPIATVYVDINGTKGPNTYGKDIFLIGIDVAKNKVIGWCSGYSSITTINKNCSQNGNRRCCADKIIIDGWQIKDNYPW